MWKVFTREDIGERVLVITQPALSLKSDLASRWQRKGTRRRYLYKR